MYIAKSLTIFFAASFLVGACTPANRIEDLGHLAPSGKQDLASFEFDLPCLNARDEGGDKQTFSLRASGPMEIAITQPSVAGSKRAWAKIHLESALETVASRSSQKAKLTYYPTTQENVDYTLTLANRSTTRELCAHLRLQALPQYEAPTLRRTFSSQLIFSSKTESVPVAFFDADATLRLAKGGTPSPNGADDVLVLPGNATGIREAMDNGMLIAVVSNQGGVSHGFVSHENAEAALAKTAELLALRGAHVSYFDMATAYDDDRKPEMGMATRLEQKLNETFGISIDWENSFMVGDAGWKKNVDLEPDGTPGIDFSNSDRGFAEALEIPYFHPRDYFNWVDHGIRRFYTETEVRDFESEYPEFPR
jgi:DNA 3'-phosphatase